MALAWHPSAGIPPLEGFQFFKVPIISGYPNKSACMLAKVFRLSVN